MKRPWKFISPKSLFHTLVKPKGNSIFLWTILPCYFSIILRGSAQKNCWSYWTVIMLMLFWYHLIARTDYNLWTQVLIKQQKCSCKEISKLVCNSSLCPARWKIGKRSNWFPIEYNETTWSKMGNWTLWLPKRQAWYNQEFFSRRQEYLTVLKNDVHIL